MTELKVCVGYELNGKTLDIFPASMTAQRDVNLFMKSLTAGQRVLRSAFLGGTACPRNQIRSSHEELIEAPVALLSTALSEKIHA